MRFTTLIAMLVSAMLVLAVLVPSATHVEARSKGYKGYRGGKGGRGGVVAFVPVYGGGRGYKGKYKG
ncbi:hypothetical protein GZH46_00365 [Fragariocoptes setiger]|uniref:Uncharacterized protein n=1 Tax=Fragariocoptes setiger TaxID=1670756 RepID=A0ABQ7SCD9_9ACAR|nr:hypothetical protein GZH46_00365 [Fragariocoptes setiger]